MYARFNNQRLALDDIDGLTGEYLEGSHKGKLLLVGEATMTTRTKKNYQKVDYATFMSAMNKLGFTAAALCDALGVSPSAATTWKAEGKVPKVVAVACEGLVRRNANPLPPNSPIRVFIIKTTNAQQAAMLQTYLKGMALESTDFTP